MHDIKVFVLCKVDFVKVDIKIGGVVAIERKIPFAVHESHESNRRVAFFVRLNVKAVKVCFFCFRRDEATYYVVPDAPDEPDCRAALLCVNGKVERRASAKRPERQCAVVFFAD